MIDPKLQFFAIFLWYLNRPKAYYGFVSLNDSTVLVLAICYFSE